MKDPIVEEVRQHRLEHTRKFKGDLSAICEDLRSIEKTSGHKVVCLAPKKLGRKKLYAKGQLNCSMLWLKVACLHSEGARR